MSKLNVNDRLNSTRSSYLAKLGAPSDRGVQLRREEREQLLRDVGVVNGNNVLACAVKRCKAKAFGNPDIYDSWACHTKTQENVLEEVPLVVEQLRLPLSAEKTLWEEINKLYAQYSVFASTVID
jgi:hypothetical protein